MKTTLTVVLAVAVYAAAFWGTWRINRLLSFGARTPVAIVWFVRIIVFVTIMFAVSTPLGLALRAI